jgi:hypothetical protein
LPQFAYSLKEVNDMKDWTRFVVGLDLAVLTALILWWERRVRLFRGVEQPRKIFRGSRKRRWS